MTDNDTTKALGGISYGGHSCTKCKYKITKGEDRCGLKGCKIARNALDLIKRQKAELDQQKSDIATLKDSNVNLQELYYAEKEKVAKAKQKVIDVCRTLKNARDEAITEFAERLNGAKFKQGYVYIICADDVSKIAKEMKEGVNK